MNKLDKVNLIKKIDGQGSNVIRGLVNDCELISLNN